MSRSSSSAVIAALGIDLGNNGFHLIGQDERGSIVLRIKPSRTQLSRRLANILHDRTIPLGDVACLVCI
jgi:transposase